MEWDVVSVQCSRLVAVAAAVVAGLATLFPDDYAK